MMSTPDDARGSMFDGREHTACMHPCVDGARAHGMHGRQVLAAPVVIVSPVIDSPVIVSPIGIGRREREAVGLARG
jgi:hypothetical protein